jgi:hypothetical protein
MPPSLEELIQKINEIEYLEYPGVGWMKAELLTVEALGRWAFSKPCEPLPDLLDRLHHSPAEAAIHRELISFFLAEWTCYQTPESSCAWWWSEDVSRYQPVSRSTAERVIDAIIASSVAARNEWLESQWWPEQKLRMERKYIVDYTKLAEVFTNELFSSSQSFFYALTPEKHTKRESWLRRIFGRQTDAKTQHADPASPSLIGISNLAIGMFWLE